MSSFATLVTLYLLIPIVSAFSRRRNVLVQHHYKLHMDCVVAWEGVEVGGWEEEEEGNKKGFGMKD